MKKVFILKANMPTFWAGDICLLEDDGSLWWVGNQDKETQKRERELHWKEKVCMFSKKTMDKFKILESGWFEEMPKDLFERIFPWDGCAYWYVTDNGIDLGHWWCTTDDLLRKSLGNSISCSSWISPAAWKPATGRRTNRFPPSSRRTSCRRAGPPSPRRTSSRF